MTKRHHRFFTTALLPLITAVLLTAGCSVKLATLDAQDQRLESLPRMDEALLEVTPDESDPNTSTIRPIDNSTIELTAPTRVPYKSLYFDLIDLIAVTGTIPPGQKEYTILLDTGFPGYALTNSLTALENDLPVLPVGEVEWYSSHAGYCQLPAVSLGSAVIADPPCMYLQQQWEFRLLGLPIWQQRGFLLGIGVLEKFGSITLDNPAEQAIFSQDGFTPPDPQNWDSHPFKIKDMRLTVTMPINGKSFDIMFDTCGRYGMVVDSAFLENLPLEDDSLTIRESTFRSGFLGELPCRRAKIETLTIGSRAVANAEILILPDASPYLEAANSMSIAFFKDTIVVLDFTAGQMHVRK